MPLLHGFGIFAGAGGGGAALAAAGYLAGGRVPTVDTVYKVLFSTDTVSTLASTLSNTNQGARGYASTTAGYIAGGYSPDVGSALDTIDKFAFADDTRSNVTSTLSTGRSTMAAFESDVSGYLAGGYNVTPPTPGRTNVIEKFPFSDDTRTVVSATLSSNSSGTSGYASPTAGYKTGGASPGPATVYETTVDKLTFASETRSTLATGLSVGRRYTAAMESSSAGYSGGGDFGATAVTTVDKFAFSDDSRTTLATGLATAVNNTAGMASSTSGYFGGGQTFSPTTYVTVINKFAFSTDSRSTLSPALPVGQAAMGSMENTRGV